MKEHGTVRSPHPYPKVGGDRVVKKGVNNSRKVIIFWEEWQVSILLQK